MLFKGAAGRLGKNRPGAMQFRKAPGLPDSYISGFGKGSPQPDIREIHRKVKAVLFAGLYNLLAAAIGLVGQHELDGNLISNIHILHFFLALDFKADNIAIRHATIIQHVAAAHERLTSVSGELRFLRRIFCHSFHPPAVTGICGMPLLSQI